MQIAIRMLLLALAGLMHAHPSARVLSANAAALAAEASNPVLGSVVEDAAALMVWEEGESAFQERPKVLWSWDARAGKSLGILQQRPGVGDAPLQMQVTAWLAALREGAKTCPDSPGAPLSGGCKQARRLADRRMARVKVLVQTFAQP